MSGVDVSPYHVQVCFRPAVCVCRVCRGRKPCVPMPRKPMPDDEMSNKASSSDNGEESRSPSNELDNVPKDKQSFEVSDSMRGKSMSGDQTLQQTPQSGCREKIASPSNELGNVSMDKKSFEVGDVCFYFMHGSFRQATVKHVDKAVKPPTYIITIDIAAEPERMFKNFPDPEDSTGALDELKPAGAQV